VTLLLGGSLAWMLRDGSRSHFGTDAGVVDDVVLEPASWDPMLPEIGWHIAAVRRRKGTPPKRLKACLTMLNAKGCRPFGRRSGRTTRRRGKWLSGSACSKFGALEHAGHEHDVWIRHLE
jgi:hypothetical protein